MTENNNDDEYRRKRLIFRSWHRGTRELDLIMGPFAEKNVPRFTSAQLKQYEEILEISDPDLYDWITQKTEPSKESLNTVLEILLREYANN